MRILLLRISMLLMVFQKKYREEAIYIIKHGIREFPYNQVKSISNPIECTLDKKLQLPYIVHKGKKLYFPKSYSLGQCERMYRGYIESECLLGGGYKKKAPHQYQTEHFKIENGDILVDVGCAEALLTLDVIDRVKKVYLIESDPIWIPALNATFADNMDKVILINKYVSHYDSIATITLKTALKDETGPIFVKMDIEGAEIDVLNSCKDFFSQRNGHIKIACCTYHHQDDAMKADALFKDMNFSYEYSDGYILFYTNELIYPYFRKGLIRAWK